jgi:hypothetical protein
MAYRRRMRLLRFAGGLLLLLRALGSEYPPILPQTPDPIQLLAMQRTAALLLGSTAADRHPVRVVVYGQSTSQQWWSRELLRELPREFADSDFRGVLQAITSFDADYLIQTAEADIYPLLPDLIIFQCYGPYGEGQAWERILREFRSRTTADIVLIGNHPTMDWELLEPTDPSEIHLDQFPSTHGPAWLNYIRNPALSRALGLCNPDIRSAWKRYLRENGLRTADLLQDKIHFNPRGSALLKAILLPYLRAPRLSPPVDPYNNSRVQTIPVGPGSADWSAGRLRLPFVGNRVDLIAKSGRGGRCRVLVDDRSPSSWPSGTGHSRSTSWKGEIYGRPAILKVGTEVPLIPEYWVLFITAVDPVDPTKVSFSLEGTVTGPDGDGVSTERFVSRSRRVVLNPENWNMRIRPSTSQVGARIVWQAQVRSVDSYEPQPLRGGGFEASTNLINDLPDDSHVLELVAEDPANPPPVAALRIYHPGGDTPGTETDGPGSSQVRLFQAANSVLAVWPAGAAEVVPEFATSLQAPWISDPGRISEMFGFRILAFPPNESCGFVRLATSPR